MLCSWFSLAPITDLWTNCHLDIPDMWTNKNAFLNLCSCSCKHLSRIMKTFTFFSTCTKCFNAPSFMGSRGKNVPCFSVQKPNYFKGAILFYCNAALSHDFTICICSNNTWCIWAVFPKVKPQFLYFHRYSGCTWCTGCTSTIFPCFHLLLSYVQQFVNYKNGFL